MPAPKEAHSNKTIENVLQTEAGIEILMLALCDILSFCTWLCFLQTTEFRARYVSHPGATTLIVCNWLSVLLQLTASSYEGGTISWPIAKGSGGIQTLK